MREDDDDSRNELEPEIVSEETSGDAENEREHLPSDEDVFDPEANQVEERPPTADQTLRYFGADFDVVGLVRRLRDKELVVPSFDPEGTDDTGYEGFQRRFVWPRRQMDRFIESLLLGYPVPGIFLVELPTRRYLVLDGQQRLRTLQAFYNSSSSARGQFKLRSVGVDFAGKTYKTLSESDRRLLDNTFIQATIVVPKDEGRDAVYRLFERINSGGVKLQPQEIRVALYSGKLVRLLRDLNQDPAWRALFGKAHSRLKDHELILRALALTESTEALRAHGWDRARALEAEASRSDLVSSEIYRPPMSTFLNHYMDRHHDLRGLDEAKVKFEFSTVTEALNAAAGPQSLRTGGRQVNAAQTDAVLVGATLALRDGLELTTDRVSRALAALQGDEEFVESISGSTSHLDTVSYRVQAATAAFAS